ncbi:thioredoxin-like protein [Jaminaea rosea]|uniref:Thioredoxin-like protein n=1 Tax=Jaminaea rosea TaxID=1569628 RepID=A0A316V106_9BASI|nr:thioredoxin-like protein [Jaminaea rosea]PWN29853.1 thioredoxin-like protein [Jaminaea rosea]
MKTSFSSAVVALLIAIVSSLVSTALSAPVSDINNPSLKGLTSTTFDSSVAKGMWFVEFFSPWCHHCKAFAPTYADLAEIQEPLEQTSDFYIRRVNCVEQGDLCDAQKVRGYPSLFLYQDGQKVDEYRGNRSFEDLMSFTTAKASDYRKAKAGVAA